MVAKAVRNVAATNQKVDGSWFFRREIPQGKNA
jgi:hypothetical protein